MNGNQVDLNQNDNLNSLPQAPGSNNGVPSINNNPFNINDNSLDINNNKFINPVNVETNLDFNNDISSPSTNEDNPLANLNASSNPNPTSNVSPLASLNGDSQPTEVKEENNPMADLNINSNDKPKTESKFNIFDNNQVSTPDNQNNLNNMNVEGNYNKLIGKSSYSDDPKVRENIEGHVKKTVPITKELKTVLIITAILFVGMMFLPMIFDLISNIKYH